MRFFQPSFGTRCPGKPSEDWLARDRLPGGAAVRTFFRSSRIDSEGTSTSMSNVFWASVRVITFTLLLSVFARGLQIYGDRRDIRGGVSGVDAQQAGARMAADAAAHALLRADEGIPDIDEVDDAATATAFDLSNFVALLHRAAWYGLTRCQQQPPAAITVRLGDASELIGPGTLSKNFTTIPGGVDLTEFDVAEGPEHVQSSAVGLPLLAIRKTARKSGHWVIVRPSQVEQTPGSYVMARRTLVRTKRAGMLSSYMKPHRWAMAVEEARPESNRALPHASGKNWSMP
jgi:hypothetical protein